MVLYATLLVVCRREWEHVIIVVWYRRTIVPCEPITVFCGSTRDGEMRGFPLHILGLDDLPSEHTTPTLFFFLLFITLFGKHHFNTINTLYLLLHAPMPAGIVVAIFVWPYGWVYSLIRAWYFVFLQIFMCVSSDKVRYERQRARIYAAIVFVDFSSPFAIHPASSLLRRRTTRHTQTNFMASLCTLYVHNIFNI